MASGDVQWGDLASLPPDTAVAFVSGSRVEGFGNPASDHDVFVVRDTADAVPRLTVSVAADGLYVDAESYRLHDWMDLAHRFAAIDPRCPEQVITPTAGELDLYYRSSIGSVVGGAQPELLAKHFDKQLACRIASGAWAQESLRFRRRAEESRRWQHWRAALEAGVDAYLAAAGEGYPSRKWRFEKAARRFGATSSFYRRAWALKAIGSMEDDEYASRLSSFLDELVPGDGAMARLERVSWRLAPDVAVVRRGSRALVVVGRSLAYELSGERGDAVAALDGSVQAVLGQDLVADPAASTSLQWLWEARITKPVAESAPRGPAS